MLVASRPRSFPLVFAANAAGPYIRDVPTASQIGVTDGAASLNDGFVPDNFTPLSAGGVPPFGQDMNGLLKQVSAWCQWQEAGAPAFYNGTFAAAIGGYPKGSILPSTTVFGAEWISAVDSNSTNPDDPLTAANWYRVGIPVGMPVPFLTSEAQIGFVTLNGLTIGNAASNATGRANDDTIFCYAFNWFNFSNTQCPILTSGGVASTRGANPYADFAANKQLTLPNTKGLGMMGVDTMFGAASTFLSGVPLTIGNSTTPGSIWGENLHTLITAELAAHTHINTLLDSQHLHTFQAPTIAGANNNNGGGGGSFAAMTSTLGGYNTALASSNITITNASAGSSGAHNTTHRSMGCYWGQKL